MIVGMGELVGKIGVAAEITGVGDTVVSLWRLLHPAMKEANKIIRAIRLQIIFMTLSR